MSKYQSNLDLKSRGFLKVEFRKCKRRFLRMNQKRIINEKLILTLCLDKRSQVNKNIRYGLLKLELN